MHGCRGIKTIPTGPVDTSFYPGQQTAESAANAARQVPARRLGKCRLLRFSLRRSRAILSAPDPNVDWVIEASLAAMRNSGAAIGDVRFPKWLLDPKLEFYDAIRVPEFAAQIKDYLATIGPEYPKTIQDMID